MLLVVNYMWRIHTDFVLLRFKYGTLVDSQVFPLFILLCAIVTSVVYKPARQLSSRQEDCLWNQTDLGSNPELIAHSSVVLDQFLNHPGLSIYL